MFLELVLQQIMDNHRHFVTSHSFEAERVAESKLDVILRVWGRFAWDRFADLCASASCFRLLIIFLIELISYSCISVGQSAARCATTSRSAASRSAAATSGLREVRRRRNVDTATVGHTAESTAESSSISSGVLRDRWGHAHTAARGSPMRH